MVRSIERIERRGVVLIWAVCVYGAATIVFGLSRSFWLTFLCLAVTGAADTVSTVLRNVIRQLGTPDHLRGRMTGVNMVFFHGRAAARRAGSGASSRNWPAPRASVVTGGIGCLIATAWIAARTPALRNYRRSSIDVNEGAPTTIGGSMTRYEGLPPLPERIRRLDELAANLWWSWQHSPARSSATSTTSSGAPRRTTP